MWESRHNKKRNCFTWYKDKQAIAKQFDFDKSLQGDYLHDRPAWQQKLLSQFETHLVQVSILGNKELKLSSLRKKSNVNVIYKVKFYGTNKLTLSSKVEQTRVNARTKTFFSLTETETAEQLYLTEDQNVDLKTNERQSSPSSWSNFFCDRYQQKTS